MITRIQVTGFKSLDDFSMDLHPGLNILVGPNGSGKTNIILFFEFLSYLVRRDVSEAISRIGGAGAVFRRMGGTDFQTTLSATVYGCHPLEQNKFCHYKYSFQILFPKEVEYVTFSSQSVYLKFTRDFIDADQIDQNEGPWDLSIVQTFDDKMKSKVKVEAPDPKLIRFPFIERASRKESSVIKRVERMLQAVGFAQEALLNCLPRYTGSFFHIVEDMIGGETYNIVPSRVKAPEDSAKAPGIEKDGAGLSATLYAIKYKKSVYPREFPSGMPYGYYFHYRRTRQDSGYPVKLLDLLTYINLANTSIYNIDASNDPFNNQLKVTLSIKDGNYQADLPLGAMSDGTIKWITLITAVLTASSIFSIEEPENYLHPLMQAQILRIMREILFVRRKYSFTIMTTHSETILNNSKPEELIVVSFEDGRTNARRCSNADELRQEIGKTGFGLGYYYLAGAIEHE